MKNGSISVLILAIVAMLGSVYAIQTPAGSTPQSSAKRHSANRGVQAASGSGAELFAVHCGRCHQPPDDLSPRVVPAVLAHMRTRAMLSHHDEQELLKFLAPQ